MHHFEQANGIRLHYIEEGNGPLVLLLHGFPDYWYSWRYQIPVLSAVGYRVVAVDLRGYNLSQRPRGIAQYRLSLLVDDIASLLERLEGERPTLVGHDWGGIIGWYLAMHQPASIDSLVVLNAPHPAALRREFSRFSSQLLRSSYAGFFQLPRIPETLLAARNFALLKRALRRGPARDDDELEQYLTAFSAPGALTAALNYYRAALRYPRPRPEPIHLPTLVLWGTQDPFLVPRLTEDLEPWVEDLEVARLPRAGHWSHLDDAQQVNQQLLTFLSRTPV